MPLPSPPQVFQTYLHSALPFRRRRSSATSTATRSSGSAPPRANDPFTPAISPFDSSPPTYHFSASPPFGSSEVVPYDHVVGQEADEDDPPFLSGSRSHLRCARCLADLCLTSQIISKGFTGRHGRAYLVSPEVFTGTATDASSASAPRRARWTRKWGTSDADNATNHHDVPSTSASASSSSSWASALHRPFSLASPLSPSSAFARQSAARAPPTPTTTSRTAQGKGGSSTGAVHPPTSLPNTHTHRPVPRTLVTGNHTVSDVSCALCGAVLGWKYVGAEDDAQRYKVGKFILETRRVVRWVGWECFDDDDDNDDNDVAGRGSGRPVSSATGSHRRGGARAGSDTAWEDVRARAALSPLQTAAVDHGGSTDSSSSSPTSASSSTADENDAGPSSTSSTSSPCSPSSGPWRRADATAAKARGKTLRVEDEGSIEFDSQDEDECEDLFAGVWSPALARKRRKARAWRTGA